VGEDIIIYFNLVVMTGHISCTSLHNWITSWPYSQKRLLGHSSFKTEDVKACFPKRPNKATKIECYNTTDLNLDNPQHKSLRTFNFPWWLSEINFFEWEVGVPTYTSETSFRDLDTHWRDGLRLCLEGENGTCKYTFS